MVAAREREAWTDWREVRGFPKITAATLAELVDGGQAFRWNRQAGEIWRGVWSSHVVEISAVDDRLCWRAPAKTASSDEHGLHHYFDATGHQERLVDQLPWRSDSHLAQCLQAFPALRILRQPFGETLLCFLCSATKQIVQIKQMVALLAERHGQPIGAGEFRLPTWEELSAVSEKALRECLLGFRAKFIFGVAQFLAKHAGWLDETERLPYTEAKERLCGLPGVGEKVADCVLLFGAGRLDAFPVDTWILKTMERRYGLVGWKPAQVAQFGRVHFGGAAGLAQQYLFAWERQNGKR
ncbi:MAG TPA: DNA glycosylase [Opitutaceae bacterium]